MKSGSMFDIGARVCGWFVAKEYETKSTSSDKRQRSCKEKKSRRKASKTRKAFSFYKLGHQRLVL